MKTRFSLVLLIVFASFWSYSKESCDLEAVSLVNQKRFDAAEQVLLKCPLLESDTSLQLLLIKVKMFQDDFETSLVLAQTFLVKNPNDQTAINAIGASYLMLEQFDSASTYFNRNLELNPLHLYSNYNMVMVKHLIDSLPEALKAIRSFQEKFPNHSEGYLYEAYMYEDAGILDTAELLYMQARKKFVGDALCYGYLAEFYYFQDRLDLALLNVNEAINLDNTDGANYYLKGVILFDLDDGRLDEAIKSFSRANESVKSAEKLNFIGQCYYYSDKEKEAIKYYGEAIALDKTRDYFYTDRADAYRFLGKNDLAIIDNDKAIQLDSSVSWNYWSRAKTLGATGAYLQAEKDFFTAISLDSINAEIYIDLATLYEYIGETNKALKCYDTAIQLDPMSINALFGRALIRTDRLNYTGALTDYFTILEIDETDADVYYNCAVIYYDQGDPLEFCNWMSKAAFYGSEDAKSMLKKYCKTYTRLLQNS